VFPQVQLAGLQQLEDANGVGATPFVTLRVKPEEDGSASTDALQVGGETLFVATAGST
jgi:hypothetical protein